MEKWDRILMMRIKYHEHCLISTPALRSVFGNEVERVGNWDRMVRMGLILRSGWSEWWSVA